jgi:hypothetical protein
MGYAFRVFGDLMFRWEGKGDQCVWGMGTSCSVLQARLGGRLRYSYYRGDGYIE